MNQAIEQRTRLCYITTHAMSAEFLMRGQLAFLREQGFDVTLIASPHESLAAVAEREGVTIVPIPMEREISPWHDLKALWRLCVALRKLKPQIVNAGTPKAGLLGNLAAWLCRVPVRIYTLRGLRLETATGWKERLLNATERLAAACAHQVIAVSHSLRDVYVTRGLSSFRKTVVLRNGSSNGVGVERFQFNDQQWGQIRELRVKWELPINAPVIGFVGRLTRDKGIPELFGAFEQLLPEFPDARLMLIGEAEQGDPLATDLLSRLQSHPNVVMTGPIKDVALYYGLFDLFAFPSYREGFPNVLLEAASTGLPVVGFKATGTIDAVIDGLTGSLVDVGDVTGLANSIGRYLRQPFVRKQHGEAGRRRVIRDFRREDIWQALVNNYRRLTTPWLAEVIDGKNGIGDSPVMQRSQRAFSPYRAFGKRLIDLCVSVPIAVMLSPLFAIIAALIKLTSRGPIFFVQERLGYHGTTFRALKFRTMTDKLRTAHQEVFGKTDEVTAVGYWLRRFKLDELPQLFNIVFGDMSLVGPRPALPSQLAEYTPLAKRRLDVRPGLTGLAQVNGNIHLSWPERWQYDAEYAHRLSFMLDAVVIVKTIAVVLFGEERFLQHPKSLPVETSSVESHSKAA